MKTFCARQGDIQIKKIAKLPNRLKQKKNNIIVSASNNHELESGKVYKASNGLIIAYLLLEKNSRVVHKTKKGHRGEHKPIELEEGIYEVKRQRTYLPKGYELVQD